MKPLKGHPYHLRSDSELHYIVADAHAAAMAVRDLDAKAEAKYLDQMNDAATILYWRETNKDYVSKVYKDYAPGYEQYEVRDFTRIHDDDLKMLLDTIKRLEKEDV
jgi:hypothetical protein